MVNKSHPRNLASARPYIFRNLIKDIKSRCGNDRELSEKYDVCIKTVRKYRTELLGKKYDSHKIMPENHLNYIKFLRKPKFKKGKVSILGCYKITELLNEKFNTNYKWHYVSSNIKKYLL